MTEDTEFLNRIFLAYPRVTFTGACLVMYRMHDADKLTFGGTTSLQKQLNWARALNYMMENLQRHGRTLRSVTQFRVSYLMWRTQEQLQANDRAVYPEFNILEDAVALYPLVFYRMFHLITRAVTAVRMRTTGSPWPKSYRARELAISEQNLLRQAGLRLEGP